MLSIFFFSCWIFISIFWLVYSYYVKPYYVLKRRVRLSGPSPKLFWGNYSEIERLGYLKSTEKWMAQYRPTFITYLGIKPVIVTEDLKVIQSVLVKNFDSFMGRYVSPIQLKESYASMIINLRGEGWRRVRRIMSPTFTSKKLRIMSPLIQESCERLRNKMVEVSNTNSSVDVWKWFGMFTLEVTLATGFSRDISLEIDKNNLLLKAVDSIFNAARTSGFSQSVSVKSERLYTLVSHSSFVAPIMQFFVRRTKVIQSCNYLEEAVLKFIENRRNTMETTENTFKDLLQLLLEAYDENGEAKSSRYLSNVEVVAAITFVMFAGYETTSNALSYTAYLLALNPTIQDNLIREINDYYEANPDSSLYDAAENIEYVNMVLCESLRLFPPTPKTNRECNQTCAVTDDLIIEEGINVSLPIFLIHHNPQYWPNPDKFDPERFNPNNEQSYPTFAYLPFGEGPRNCVGKRLALLVAKMTLITILKDLQFKGSADTEVPLDLSVGILTSPRNGIKLCIASNSS